jgi:hypothetical protein
VGQPDLQVVDGLGSPIGYGETKPIGSAATFARVLESEQVERYRRSIDNLLVTDFLRFSLFRTDLGRLDVVLVEGEAKLLAGAHPVSAAQSRSTSRAPTEGPGLVRFACSQAVANVCSE